MEERCEWAYKPSKHGKYAQHEHVCVLTKNHNESHRCIVCGGIWYWPSGYKKTLVPDIEGEAWDD